MIVAAIVAIGKNNEIGKNNDLLWHLPADMKYFRTTTTGHHIITGRKSYTSIPEKYRPLPNRTNVVITRKKDLVLAGATVVSSIESALAYAENNNESEVFIIGGGEIYQQCLEKDLVDRLYITHVEKEFDADTFFPPIDTEKWKLSSEKKRGADEKNIFDLSFAVYERK